MKLRSAWSSALALGLVSSLTLLAAGCGDDSSESSGAPAGAEDQIETVAERFERVIAEKDTEAFCRVLAPNDVQKLGEGNSDGTKECLLVWGAERNPLFSAEDPDLEIESLSFEGGYATAELSSGGELGFAKEGGRWYVHLAPAPEQMTGAGS